MAPLLAHRDAEEWQRRVHLRRCWDSMRAGVHIQLQRMVLVWGFSRSNLQGAVSNCSFRKGVQKAALIHSINQASVPNQRHTLGRFTPTCVPFWQLSHQYIHCHVCYEASFSDDTGEEEGRYRSRYQAFGECRPRLGCERNVTVATFFSPKIQVFPFGNMCWYLAAHTRVAPL